LATGITAAGILGGIGGAVHSTQKAKKSEKRKRRVINRAVQMYMQKRQLTIENPEIEERQISIRENFEQLEQAEPNIFRALIQAAAEACYPKNHVEFLKSFAAQHSSRDEFVLLNVDEALELMANLKGEALNRALNEKRLLQPVEA